VQRLIAYFVITGLFFFLFFFCSSLANIAFAQKAYDCDLGMVSQGSCINGNIPPNTAPPYAPNGGNFTCEQFAEIYTQSESIEYEASCENYCAIGAGPFTDPVCGNVRSLCPRSPSVDNPDDGDCADASTHDPGGDVYCCRYIASPTDTPTPPPPGLWMIKGIVFYDQNNDGVINSLDTVYGSGASIFVKDGLGAPTNTPFTNYLGFYQTPRIWTDKHLTITKLLTALPSGCTVRIPPGDPVNAYMNSDKIINFPIVGHTTIQGRNVDKFGNALATNIGQKITIAGPTISTSTSYGAWSFNYLPMGSTYTVTATIPTGYAVSYAYAGDININSPDGDSYVDGNTLSITLPKCGDYADIWFKYTPLAAKIQGHFADENDQFVSRRLGTTNRTVQISGGGLASPVEPLLYDIPTDFLWKHDSLPVSPNLYTVTVPTKTRYDIYNATCPKNTSCTPTYASSPASRKLNSVTPSYLLNVMGDYAEVAFKYVPLVMIQGHFVDENDQFVSRTLNGVDRTIDISGGRLGTFLWPSSTVHPLYNTTTDFLWKYDPLPASSNPYVVSASPMDEYDIYYAVCSAKNQSDCGNPRENYVYANSFTLVSPFLLDTVDDWTDIYFKYIPVGPTPTGGATPTPTRTPTPTINPGPFSISGKIFQDTNKNGKSNVGEPNYTNAITISVKNNSTSTSYAVTSGSGNYTTNNNLPAGQYTVTFSGLLSGWRFTYPPSPLIVTVGTGCSVPVTSDASCVSGNIQNLNAGVTTDTLPWIQSTGSDIRVDSGVNINVPATKYASIIGMGGMPGVIFSGATTSNFGVGQASVNGWQVGTPANPDIFTDTHSLVPTSYKFLLETAQGSGITPIDLITPTNYCGAGGLSNCALGTRALPHGIYISHGNLSLSSTSYTFPAGNFIILVDGNLTINGRIQVPLGSTVIFSVNGSITVSSNVGELASQPSTTCAVATHAGCAIEGLYSADNNFVVNGVFACNATIDKRLNIAGSVIVNAGRTGGTFVNNRSLCGNDANYPSVSFTERPDFMLNYPSLTKQNARIWQDVAP
jgi:hypothetical protein